MIDCLGWYHDWIRWCLLLARTFRQFCCGHAACGTLVAVYHQAVFWRILHHYSSTAFCATCNRRRLYILFFPCGIVFLHVIELLVFFGHYYSTDVVVPPPFIAFMCPLLFRCCVRRSARDIAICLFSPLISSVDELYSLYSFITILFCGYSYCRIAGLFAVWYSKLLPPATIVPTRRCRSPFVATSYIPPLPQYIVIN